MRHIPFTSFFLLASIVVTAGCSKPGPVELQKTQQSQVFDVQPILGEPNFENEADTTGLTASEKSQYFGQLIISGVRFTSANENHTVSLVRATFLDSSRPIIWNARTIGYRTMDAGSVLIDGLPLRPTLYRIRYAGGPDTLAGVQHELVSKDGIGGRGFIYSSAHQYEWTNSGSSNIALNVRAQSAGEVQILRPTPQDNILLRQDLSVEWRGENELRLIISIPQSAREVLPVLRMRLRSNDRRVIIPAKVLQMLPIDRSVRFVFTFISQKRSEAQVTGFPNQVLVYFASIHNILLSVQR